MMFGKMGCENWNSVQGFCLTCFTCASKYRIKIISEGCKPGITLSH